MTTEKKYEFRGQMLTRKEICRMTGLSKSTLCSRMYQGMTADEAVSMGINPGKAVHKPKVRRSTKSLGKGAQRVVDIYETDSAGNRRKKWKFLSGYDTEMQKVRETCRKCRHAAFSGKTFCGCSYFDDVGRCRMCDPRDCVELGFFESKKRGPKPKRIPRIVL